MYTCSQERSRTVAVLKIWIIKIIYVLFYEIVVKIAPFTKWHLIPNSSNLLQQVSLKLCNTINSGFLRLQYVGFDRLMQQTYMHVPVKSVKPKWTYVVFLQQNMKLQGYLHYLQFRVWHSVAMIWMCNFIGSIFKRAYCFHRLLSERL
jgi:hypothetical protein